MVVLTSVAIWNIIEIRTTTQDAGLYPTEKNDTLFSDPEKEALERGIPVVYGNITDVNSKQLFEGVDSSYKTPLVVTVIPVMDEFGKDMTGIIKKYQYGTNINEVRYRAPHFYNIESYNSFSVVLEKDDLGIDGEQAFTVLGWLMFETIFGLILIALSMSTAVTIKQK